MNQDIKHQGERRLWLERIQEVDMGHPSVELLVMLFSYCLNRLPEFFGRDNAKSCLMGFIFLFAKGFAKHLIDGEGCFELESRLLSLVGKPFFDG